MKWRCGSVRFFLTDVKAICAYHAWQPGGSGCCRPFWYLKHKGGVKLAKKEKYDVIVVGAGPGGITCAALLAKRGLDVLVLDKNERVGGKQMTVSMKGYKGERWPTGGLPVKGGAWLEAFRAWE